MGFRATDSRGALRQGSLPLSTRLIATVFYAGYSGFAPGTVGSAVALCVYCLLPPLDAFLWVAFLVPLFFLSVYAAAAGESVWGDDPSPVVIDEFVGYFVTVCALPQSLGVAVAAFFLFRVLDIVKPPPVRQSEALPGGWGIVGDDVLAGVYGNLILRGALALWGG